MGLSHLSMIRTHSDVDVVAVCDASKYLLDVVGKYAGISAFSDYKSMLAEAAPDAVIIATPSRMHAPMVRTALESGLHVFCEKPFCLDWTHSEALAAIAEEKGLVNQVGYHYRFVCAFQEAKRILESGALGKVTHVKAEAYGPVVLRTKGMTWRIQKGEGGGCLYDYAAHPVNLLNWYFGLPESVGGTVIKGIFSKDTDDEVCGTIRYANGLTAQLTVNWSDESHRKMSVKFTAWGTTGRLYADRQECQLFLRDAARLPPGYRKGWNVRYTTELTQPVWFYVRGEEFSAQLDYFVHCISTNGQDNVNSFASAAQTDRVLAMMVADAQPGLPSAAAAASRKATRFSIFS
jgi:predicted dehydrogenase